VKVTGIIATVATVGAIVAVAPLATEDPSTISFMTRSSGPDLVELAPQTHEERAQRIELHLLELVNHERHRHGLAPLAWSDELAEGARRWSAHLSGGGPLHLDDPLAVAARSAGFTTVADDVIGVEGLVRASAIHLGWLRDDEARGRMLDPSFDHLGVGVVCTENGGTYVTLRFGLSTAAPSSDPPEGAAGEQPAARWRAGATCFEG
jgi:uncharacterized protein YkwD